MVCHIRRLRRKWWICLLACWHDTCVSIGLTFIASTHFHMTGTSHTEVTDALQHQASPYLQQDGLPNSLLPLLNKRLSSWYIMYAIRPPHLSVDGETPDFHTAIPSLSSLPCMHLCSVYVWQLVVYITTTTRQHTQYRLFLYLNIGRLVFVVKCWHRPIPWFETHDDFSSKLLNIFCHLNLETQQRKGVISRIHVRCSLKFLLPLFFSKFVFTVTWHFSLKTENVFLDDQ